jgi:hypothetical protein
VYHAQRYRFCKLQMLFRIVFWATQSWYCILFYYFIIYKFYCTDLAFSNHTSWLFTLKKK